MEQDKVIPLDTQRRLMAYQTAKSWEEVPPHVAYLYEPDATELYQAYLRRREELSGQGLRLTLNTLLLKAVAEGLKAAPLLNAHFAFEKGDHSGEIRVKKEISPSVPWLLEGDQMLTVTVPDIGSKTLKETAEAVEAIQKKLEMTDLPQLMRDVALGRDSGGQGLRRGGYPGRDGDGLQPGVHLPGARAGGPAGDPAAPGVRGGDFGPSGKARRLHGPAGGEGHRGPPVSSHVPGL